MIMLSKNPHSSLLLYGVQQLFSAYFHQDMDIFYGDETDEEKQIFILVKEFWTYADEDERKATKSDVLKLLALPDEQLTLADYLPDLDVIPEAYEGGARGLLKNILASLEQLEA